MKVKLAMFVALLLVGATAVAMAKGRGEPVEPGPSVGQPAPNFTLRDLNGNPVELTALKGKVVVLDFWASWCPPCRKGMPNLEKLHREFRNKGVVVIGINTEDEQTARQFIQGNGYSFMTAVDADGTVSKLYDIEYLPTTFIIGKDGKIVTTHVGYGDEAQLRADLASAGIR